jgi:CPA2 family monovalent cation:H+ antiporter-2
MHGDRPFLQDLALVLCVAGVTAVLFRRLRQPVVLGYLLAGVLVGPFTPIGLVADAGRVQALSELGVILVMFSIGLEFSLRKLVHVFPRAGFVGLIQIGCMYWLGHAAAQLLGWGTAASLFAGAIVSISSTMIVAKVAGEQRLPGELTELVYGVLIVQDLAAILFLAVLTAVGAGGGQSTEALLATAGRLMSFVLALTVGGYLLIPPLIRLIARSGSSETLLVSCVGLCFCMASLAEHAGYSVALGSFVAGALVAESGKHRQVEPQIRPLRDLFAAVFFVAVGMLVDPSAIVQQWEGVLALLAVVVVGQVVSVSLGAFLGGHEPVTALRAGMTLAQIGEFSFILAAVGVATGVMDASLYSIVVGVAVATTFTTPWLVRLAMACAPALVERLPESWRTFAWLYGSWIEDLRTGLQGEGARFRLLRLAGRLALDVLCFAGVVIATSVYLERMVRLVRETTGWSYALTHALVLVGAAFVSVPFLVGIVRLSRALGQELATAALGPRPEPGGAVPASAHARRAFVVALQLGIVILVGAPLLALTQPFVPVPYEASVVFLGLGGLAISFWRRANALDAHVRAGAQVVVDVLQRGSGHGGHQELESVATLLPGLGEVTPCRLAAGSSAIGHTLAQLDLRKRTGASVLAIRRSPDEMLLPTGQEVLADGDELVLSGSPDALAAAQRLLRGTAPAAAPGRGA